MIAGASGGETAPSIGPDEPAVHAIRLAFLKGGQRLRQNDAAAQQGEVEGVHRMRTTARRLRSDLRLFRDLLDADWADRRSRELKWLGQMLGAVRDPDVMHERLRKAAGDLVDDLGPLFAMLAEEHASAATALREALEGEEYRDLLEHLSEAAEHPPLRDGAWEPCRAALPSLAHRSWERLKSAGRALDLGDADEDYHEVRKRAKHARYTAECVAPALDSEPSRAASRFARRALAVQDILGEHQDSTIAGRLIRRVVAERPGDGPFNLAAGRLIERQEIVASDSRARFFKIWHRLDRRKNSRWMKI